MSLVRRVARPLLAASFLAAGADAVLHPMPKADAARPLVERLAPAVGLPPDAELLIRAAGTVQLGAGALFALGRMPRLSAVLLAASLLPSAAAEGAFWREQDPETRRERRTQLLREAGLLGGALLGAVDTAGQPGLGWRGRRAVRTTRRTAKRIARETKRNAKRARADHLPG
ncbi:MAG: putative oxidoreductase [Actinomycetota bacterium]|nr:putative oxidoreductase [Actinomycetota bacterium]